MKRLLHLLTLLLLLLCTGVAGCARSEATRQIRAYGGSWVRKPVTGQFDTYVSFDADAKRLSDHDVATLVPSLRALGTVSIELDDAGITDAAIPALRGPPHLFGLMVRGTAVTPAGLRELRRMPRLRVLGVDAATFSEDDVRLLARDLPHVSVVRWERSPEYPGGWRPVR